MKKIILSTMVTIALTATVQAKDVSQYLNFGANQSTIAEESGTGFDITYGGMRTWENGIMAAFDVNYGQGTIEEEIANN